MFPKGDYDTAVLGDHKEDLGKGFYNEGGLSYLNAVLSVADLVFVGYATKQGTLLRENEADEGNVNSDVLNTVLLSLHPMDIVKKLTEINLVTTKDVEKTKEISLRTLYAVDDDVCIK